MPQAGSGRPRRLGVQVFFDIGMGEILALAGVALLVFGPERLPKAAAQAGRAVRDLRRFVASTRADIEKEIGPELRDLGVSDLKVGDLNPRSIVRRHVVDGVDLGLDDAPDRRRRDIAVPRADGGSPAPYDPDAT